MSLITVCNKCGNVIIVNNDENVICPHCNRR